jgi:hypothetical protein
MAEERRALWGGCRVAVVQGRAEEPGFEFETENLGRIRFRPLNFKLLFRFIDLIKSEPDSAPNFVCALLSVVGEREDASVPEDRGISREQAKTLSDEELEQFAARFLEAANWIGLGGKAAPTTEGVVECSYGERLKWAFEAYEKRLGEHTKLYPSTDHFSGAVPSQSEHGSRLFRGASVEAERPAFGDWVKQILSGFWNGGLEQCHRAVGVARSSFKRFSANIAGKWQRRSGALQHISKSLATLGALKQELVIRELSTHILHKIEEWLEKMTASLKALRSQANQWATKLAYHRVSFGVVVIGLLSALFLYLIARMNSRSQELAAIGALTDTVHSLSQRVDAQTRELAELIKQHDSEQRTAAQQTTPLDSKHQKGIERRPRRHSSLGGRHREIIDMHPYLALKLGRK